MSTTTLPILCPCCKNPTHQFENASMIAGRPAHQMVECHTIGCVLHMITLNAAQFVALTPAQIDGYRRAIRA